MPAKVAVVLSGCGFKDGSEIHEAVSCLIHLDRHQASVSCFAPDKPQADVVNHATGKPATETRNVMVEAGRIARGQIAPLSRLDVEAFDAVVFPGGFGAAKNLCTFAKDGPDCRIDPDVERVVKGFKAAGKPIAMCCIAPVIGAKVLGTMAGGPGCEVTIGADAGTADAIAKMGSKNLPREVTEAVVDTKNRVVTTPAYMCDAGPHGVFTGIGKMIDETIRLTGRA
jgi:enhancing lycopene biosynthesis protein 2